jgi:hypothetical protein
MNHPFIRISTPRGDVLRVICVGDIGAGWARGVGFGCSPRFVGLFGGVTKNEM